MSLRAQICSSPMADITLTTRSFPSANPSLICTFSTTKNQTSNNHNSKFNNHNSYKRITAYLSEESIISW
ncbi:hypothetical protein Hanom_Chr09g00840701 [Helianthus anomalus]